MMSRLSALIKKDFILLKRNIYTGVALSVFTPILMGFGLVSLNLGVSTTITAYLSGVIYTTFILYFYIALEEAKYSKATILLNSIFTKKEIVNARYLFFLLTIMVSTLIFIPLALLLNSWFSGFSLYTLIVSISLALVITSIFIPFTYRWNIDVTKYVISIFLLILSFAGVNMSQPIINIINSSNQPQLSIFILFVISVFGLIVSKTISIKFFQPT